MNKIYNTGGGGKWPKTIKQLSAEQLAIRDDFMRSWLEMLPGRWFGIVEKFNHGYPLRTFQSGSRTLEIGAGIGSHLQWENYTEQDYYALDLRSELCERIASMYPGVHAVPADCQKRLPWENEFFDRVVAIHVLEHLPDLPAALAEIHRVLKNDGILSVVIPCEGSFATKTARNFSSRRFFEKKYKTSYDWLIESEHINLPDEIIEELDNFFAIKHFEYYPFFMIPFTFCNLFIGITLIKNKL
jgi:SAM-dependent methyltransferase